VATGRWLRLRAAPTSFRDAAPRQLATYPPPEPGGRRLDSGGDLGPGRGGSSVCVARPAAGPRDLIRNMTATD
jgi:hypothetical protein